MSVTADCVLARLAALLTYPEGGYLRQAEMARAALAEDYPEAARHLAEFTRSVNSFGTEQLQELFTQTFDLNPICAMEVGWQLYGDEYKRGEFLVRMRQLLRQHNLPPSTELPDHLTQALPLLERLSPAEAEAMARQYVLPALRKMLAGMEGKQNPFEDALKCVAEVLDNQTARHGKEARHE